MGSLSERPLNFLGVDTPPPFLSELIMLHDHAIRGDSGRKLLPETLPFFFRLLFLWPSAAGDRRDPLLLCSTRPFIDRKVLTILPH